MSGALLAHAMSTVAMQLVIVMLVILIVVVIVMLVIVIMMAVTMTLMVIDGENCLNNGPNYRIQMICDNSDSRV